MQIAIIGHTGFIGSAITAEALARGHHVLGLSRNPGEAAEGLTPLSADSRDTKALAEALRGVDAAVVAVRWNENSVVDLVSAIREAGVSRAIFVVGAGSLNMPDGRLWLEHMIEQGIAPPTSRSAMKALDYLRDVDDLDWAAVSPAKDIEAGERTGQFTLGTDEPVVDGNGESRISTGDFAVAVIDQIETPTVHRARLTLGYS